MSELHLSPHSQKPLSLFSAGGKKFGKDPDNGAIYYLDATGGTYDGSYFLHEYANQYGRTYYEDEMAHRNYAKRRLTILQHFLQNEKTSLTLFEAGCAAGYFLDEARKLGYEVTGCDPSPDAITYAREKLQLEVQCSGFLDYPTQTVYDAIAAFFVMEHLPDQKLAFQHVFDLLKPGGLFLFALPSSFGPMFHFHKQEWGATHPADHYADYSPASLAKIFPLYGLTLLYTEPFSFHPERLPSPFGAIAKNIATSFWKSLFTKLSFGDTLIGIARKDNQSPLVHESPYRLP